MGSGGSINITLGGGSTFAGQPTFDYCSGPMPHFAPNRWSIADLDGSLDLAFGAGTRLGAALPGESTYQRDISPQFVSALFQVARQRVKVAAADAAGLELCEADDQSPDCAQNWLRDYGLKLYRRPLAAEQMEAYLVAYQSARAETNAVQAAENVLVSMIMSPYFALRIELGAGDGQLSQFEVASRISHFAARRAPDLELLESAARGELAVPESGVQHLHRLWSTPEGRAARELMVLEWLGVQNESQRTELAPELRADMDAQLRGFISNVFDNQNGALDALLAGSRFPLNARLAKHYGITLELGDELELQDLEPSLFAGVLTSGAFLSRVSSPSVRGERVMNALLCAELPAPSPEAHQQPLLPAATPREQLALTVGARPPCQACHQTFDPVGLALSAFDADGELSGWDSSGSITTTPTSPPVALANPQGLANAIVNSAATRECIGRRYLELVLDRKVPSSSSLYIGAPRPMSPERQWLNCFNQSLGASNPSLIGFAESLVRSSLMRLRDDVPHRLLAFDTSSDPLEHAYQEAVQLDGAYPNESDAAIVAEYARALDAVRELPPLGAGGAGGESMGGASGESMGGAGGAR
jgi:hypothetical protein